MDEKKPDWWPECPYPEDIFPMTTDEFVKAVPDGKLRSAISGCVGRFAWRCAENMIWDRWRQHVKDMMSFESEG